MRIFTCKAGEGASTVAGVCYAGHASASDAKHHYVFAGRKIDYNHNISGTLPSKIRKLVHLQTLYGPSLT